MNAALRGESTRMRKPLPAIYSGVAKEPQPFAPMLVAAASVGANSLQEEAGLDATEQRCAGALGFPSSRHPSRIMAGHIAYRPSRDWWIVDPAMDPALPHQQLERVSQWGSAAPAGPFGLS